MKQTTKQHGFTLIELMIAITIAGILLALAVPSFVEQIQRRHLKAATEELYSDFKYIHSESVKNRASMFISFKEGTSWCYGVDDAGTCDCSTANDCQVNGIEKVVASTDFAGTALTITGLPTVGGYRLVQFDGIRGTTNSAGVVSFALAGNNSSISINRMGHLRNCSNNIVSYTACP